MISNSIDDQKSPFLAYGVYDAIEWTETEMAVLASLAHSSYIATNSVV